MALSFKVSLLYFESIKPSYSPHIRQHNNILTQIIHSVAQLILYSIYVVDQLNML